MVDRTLQIAVVRRQVGKATVANLSVVELATIADPTTFEEKYFELIKEHHIGTMGCEVRIVFIAEQPDAPSRLIHFQEEAIAWLKEGTEVEQ